MANANIRNPSVFTLDTDVEVWLSRFDNYLELNRVFGERDKINILGSFLDDTTFRMIDSLVNETTYNDVKNRLRVLFSKPPAPKHVYLKTFSGRTQELTESLVQYAAALHDIGRKAFPNLIDREFYSYLREQYLAGIRNRALAERLAGLDIPDMATLVNRARELEGNFLGFDGFYDNRVVSNGFARKHLTNEQIRNLVTPKYEPYQQNQPNYVNEPYQQNQPNYVNQAVELARSQNELSFAPMNWTAGNYSRLINQPNDGSYLDSPMQPNRMNTSVRTTRSRCFNCNQEGHVRRNCPHPQRNMHNDYYRLGYESHNDSRHTPPLNRSTPINNRNVQFHGNNGRPNTNNVNEESEDSGLAFVYGYIDEEKIECLLDTGSNRTIISDSVWNRVKKKYLLDKCEKGTFTLANGQPLDVYGAFKTKVRVGLNELELKVHIANDLQHECLIGLDFMSRVDGTKDKLNEIYASLEGERVPSREKQDEKVDFVKFTEEEQKKMNEFLVKNEDMFAESLKDLGCCNFTMHSINTQGSSPIREPPRRIPHHLKDEIKRQLDELVESQIIEPSSSEWATALVPVKKKNGKIRLCIDYRELNKVTKKDSYPIPRLDDTTDKFFDIKCFTTLDMASGYYQVKMDPKDREKTAITTPFGLFQFIRMPFGLTNAPATFQRMVDRTLRDLIGKICLVYLDDIIVFSKTVDEHLVHLNLVFERLRTASLKLNKEKCYFMKDNVVYLGHVISQDGVLPCEDKVKAIKDFPISKTLKQLQSFLGITGYYRKFIRDYAKIASPLFKCCKKNTSFRKLFDKRCENAFNKLKEMITSDDFLCFPNFKALFKLETDASDVGIGAVLSQKRDGEWRPIAYWSRHLSKAEQNYSTTEKEALAIVCSIEHFRVYLYGQEFLICTDHQPLKWMFNIKEPQPRIARWIMKLSEYQFQIEYKPGKVNGNADGLSRWPMGEAVSDEKLDNGEDIIEGIPGVI